MKVEFIKTNDIKAYSRNTKAHPSEQIFKIVRSIKDFGFNVPILIDKENIIIAGHGRLLAAKELGLESVPIIRVEHLADAQIRAFRIADNKTTESEWLWNELKLELEELADLNIDLEATGFNTKSLDDFFGKNSESKATNATTANSTIIKKSGLNDLAPSESDRSLFLDKKIIIQFSGGKDSSAASVWVKHFFPDNEAVLIYCDLGTEFIGFNLFLHNFSMNIDLPLITIRTKDHLIDLLLIKGKWPHFGGPYCQNLMNRAMDIYIKSHDPKEVIIVRGGRMEERGKRQNPPKPNRWLTIRRNSDYKYFQPMYFASKDVGQAILEKLEMPIWEGYSFGLQRTACRVCPGQRPIGYAAIRANFPYIWEELLNLESILGPGCWNDPLKNKSQGSFTYLADHGQRAFELGNYRKTTSNMINFDTVTF